MSRVSCSVFGDLEKVSTGALVGAFDNSLNNKCCKDVVVTSQGVGGLTRKQPERTERIRRRPLLSMLALTLVSSWKLLLCLWFLCLIVSSSKCYIVVDATIISSVASSDGNVFPGIYSITTSTNRVKQLAQSKIWMFMDVLEMDCWEQDENNNDSTEESSFCLIHTLIITQQEYQHLQLLLLEFESPAENDGSTALLEGTISLQYNATLSHLYVDFRLKIVHQSNESRRLSVTADGYSAIYTYECYCDYDGMIDWIQDFVLEAKNTGLFQVEFLDIGDSFLKTQNDQEGDDIQVLTITLAATNVTTAAPLILFSSTHAREYAPPEVVRRFLKQLLEKVRSGDPKYISLLQTTQIHWVPYVNVDGRRQAETFQPWRRKNMNNQWNMQSSYCSSDTFGVDLNRNYPFQWGLDEGSSRDACSPFSRGKRPASEPEIKAVLNYAYALFPESQKIQGFHFQSRTNPDALPRNWKGFNESTTVGVFCDLHSYGEVYVFPWGNANTPTPNHEALQAPLGKMEQITGYQALGPGRNFYGVASGASDDAFFALFGAVSMTWEIGSSFHEPCDSFEAVLPSLISSMEYLLSIAPQPYSLGQGPDIVLATITPDAIQGRETVSLVIHASDSARQALDLSTARQQVVEIRLYVEHPLLMLGNENDLVPLGAWSDAHRDFSYGKDDNDNDVAIVETTLSWQPVLMTRGVEHQLLYIQAKDSDGYWGPVEALSLTIMSPGGSFTVSQSKSPPPTANILVPGQPPSMDLLQSPSAMATINSNTSFVVLPKEDEVEDLTIPPTAANGTASPEISERVTDLSSSSTMRRYASKTCAAVVAIFSILGTMLLASHF